MNYKHSLPKRKMVRNRYYTLVILHLKRSFIIINTKHLISHKYVIIIKKNHLTYYINY